MNNNPTITFLIGPPASGKSTYTAKYGNGSIVISRDNIVEKLRQNTNMSYSEKLTNVLYNVRNNREYNQLNDEIQKLKHKLQGGVYQTYLKMENPYIFDAKGKDGYNGWQELKINIGYKTAVGVDAIEAISGNNDMYKSNYDGIIAKNIIDLHLGDTNYSKYNQFMGDVYMVFSTSQTMIEKEI